MADQRAVLREACLCAAIAICDSIKDNVNRLPFCLRAKFCPSMLKPAPEVAASPDTLGEKIAVQHLHQLSKSIGHPIHLVIDPCAELYLRITPDSSSMVTAPDSSTAQQKAAQETRHGQQGPSDHDMHQITAVWCYLDAVDGTLKLSGLFNQPQQQDSSCSSQQRRLRVVNDGSWAIGIAFSDRTSKTLKQLQVKDFTVAAIVDGNPPKHKSYPVQAVARAQEQRPAESGQQLDSSAARAASSHSNGHTYQTLEWNDTARTALYTTSCPCLSRCFAWLDAFQAHDSRTASAADAELAVQLYRLLIDRQNGGAFDVLRQYGNLGSLLRNMLGWRPDPSARGSQIKDGTLHLGNASTNGDAHTDILSKMIEQVTADGDVQHEAWLEPQCGVFLAVNENLANLIPAVPIIVGAGGIATDLQGHDLLERSLAHGRVSVVYAANAELHAEAMRLITRAAELACMPKQ